MKQRSGQDENSEAAAGLTKFSGSPRSKWRSYGEARRRELLELDAQKGGTSFHMNSSCSVYKYFKVSIRATDQFHKMIANEKANSEETYVMGHRMICFLSDFLPTHPDYKSPEVAELRDASIQELHRIRQSLEDLALRIDEYQLNKFFTDDFDPILDDDDSSNGSVENEHSGRLHNQFHRQRARRTKSPSKSLPPQKIVTAASVNENLDNWQPFAGWNDSTNETREMADSPTPETVATTGTGSFEEVYDTSSNDSDDRERGAERRLEFSESEEEDETHRRSGRYFSMEFEVDLDFLKKIANEDVRYETDSEAVDSWAQDNDSIALISANSGVPSVTYDPAKLVLRELCSNRPSPVKEEDSRMLSASDSSTHSADVDDETLGDSHEGHILIHDLGTASANQRDIGAQRQDALHQGYASPHFSEPQGKENSWHSFDSIPEKENEPDATFFSALVKPDVLEQDEWVSFDSQPEDTNSRRRVQFRSVRKAPATIQS